MQVKRSLSLTRPPGVRLVIRPMWKFAEIQIQS
jgi:hypothetical protein